MISVNEPAGWCRRVSISLNAGLDIITVLEREGGKHSEGKVFVPPESSGRATVAPPPVIGATTTDADDDLDETNPYDYRERLRRRDAAWREQIANRPRKPPIFLYSNMQKLCGYAAVRVREGASLYEAFSEVGGHFPKMFVPMIAVAERSGSLGETFGELARYYEFQLKLKREFWRMMIYPIFNLCAAVFVVLLYIIIMGALERSVTLFGVQFAGVFGALKFLLFCGCFVAIGAGVYYIFKHYVSAGNNILHFALNAIPKIGTAMRCFAMARFVWALQFTTKTGMDIREAVILAFDVAAYGPINQHMNKVLEQLGHGVSLYEAFSKTKGFPHEFLMFLQTGEQSGELPESLAKLAEEYNDQVRMHMKQISVACYFAVFFFMVIIMVMFIFQVGQAYFGTLNEAVTNPMGD